MAQLAGVHYHIAHNHEPVPRNVLDTHYHTSSNENKHSTPVGVSVRVPLARSRLILNSGVKSRKQCSQQAGVGLCDAEPEG
jgi:hypothetical protein